jgi:hypothetical protein
MNKTIFAANGKNGNGGSGGKITVLAVRLVSGTSIKSDLARAGLGGKQTVSAARGTGGDGGFGGCASKNIFGYNGRSCYDGWCFWCYPESDYLVAKHGATGNKGADGTVPALPAAGSNGVAGTSTITRESILAFCMH